MIVKKALSLLLVLVMLCGMMPMTAFAAEDAEVTESVAPEQIVDTDKLYNPIAVNKGQLASGYDGSIIDSDIYGYVVNYPLKKGHVLSISDTNYVFSVRKWENGNYSTMLKQATTANYTATEDMTVAMLIRKPDKSAVTAEELADIVIYDSQFGMIGVEGSVKRFTVEAETIDGGTATTRAAIFLPETYSENGDTTELVVMTNGLHGYISDSVWNSGTADDIALMKNYMETGYAVLVVDNTLGKTGGAPDWGNPQLVSSYWKAYKYVQANLNLEEEFFLHSRSMGTFSAIRIMREHPELVKCAIMCGATASLRSRFGQDPKHLAKMYGFDDLSGETYEADKVIGYDPYVDVVDAAEYALPSTLWMLSEADANSKVLSMIKGIEGHGNDVTKKVYAETDHSGVCRLNIAECWNDAIAYFEAHKERTSEHRFCSWNITPATCEADGEMTRKCTDCGYTQRQTLEATGFHALDKSTGTCAQCGALLTVAQYGILTLTSGQFNNTNGAPVASNIYGCVIGYELKKGHTLSISDTNYVFAIRQLVNGNYNTLLKSATTDSFTAEENMIVSIRVRKPDSSALTACELASVMLIDTVLTVTNPHTHTYSNGICTVCGEAQPGPMITQQPVDGEAKMGERYMVEVLAEGEGLTYQWYGRNAGSKSWFKSSVKDNTYDDVMTEARAGREVYCVITDANGNSVKTDTVKLVLLPSEELEITQQPTDDQVYFGEHFCATVEAKGEKLKYQWYFRNAGSDKWYKSSVKDNTYDDVMTKARAGREIYCVITDAYGNSVTTETVKLICIPTELEIISQPTSAEVYFGEMFCATVEAKGDGLKYQWYFRNSGTDKWYKSGVRDNTYDDVMTKARNHREIYCVITDMWGNSVTTDTVKLTAVPSVELKVLSQSYESAVMGERYCVTVEAQGDGLNYQWYFRNAGASRWSKSSVRDNTYDDVMNKTRANREVYCVISDACGNQITTEVITLTVEQ